MYIPPTCLLFSLLCLKSRIASLLVSIYDIAMDSIMHKEVYATYNITYSLASMCFMNISDLLEN